MSEFFENATSEQIDAVMRMQNVIAAQQATIAKLRTELAKRIDEPQRKLLMRSLARATGCTEEEITCGPLDCAIRRAKEVEQLSEQVRDKTGKDSENAEALPDSNRRP